MSNRESFELFRIALVAAVIGVVVMIGGWLLVGYP